MNLNLPKYAQVRQQLCGEYVLGTLRGPARRRFVQLLRRDASLLAEVTLWEAQLTPLAFTASHISPQIPSDAVWQGIDARLFAHKPQHARTQTKTSWWNNLLLWRTASFASAAAAFAMAAVLLAGKPDSPSMATAVLADAGLYTRDPKRFAAVMAELDRVRADLAAAEERWLGLAEKEAALAG